MIQNVEPMVSVVLVKFVMPTLMKMVQRNVLQMLFKIVTKTELAKIVDNQDVLMMVVRLVTNKFVNKQLESAEVVLLMPNVVLPILEMPSTVTKMEFAEIVLLLDVTMMVVNLEPLLDAQLLLDFLSVPKNLDNLFAILLLVDVKIYVYPMIIVQLEQMPSLLLEEVPIVKLMVPVSVAPLPEDLLPILPLTVELMMVLEMILQDEVVFLGKPTVEVLEFALMKPDVQEMKTVLPLVEETIVKSLVDVSLVLSHMKLPLALAMMVVNLLVNPIVTSLPDFVLVVVTMRMTVLEPKVLTAWLIKFAMIAAAMLIAKPTMLGVETELEELSV